jgi:hypothetical protein
MVYKDVFAKVRADDRGIHPWRSHPGHPVRGNNCQSPGSFILLFKTKTNIPNVLGSFWTSENMHQMDPLGFPDPVRSRNVSSYRVKVGDIAGTSHCVIGMRWQGNERYIMVNTDPAI